MASADFPLLLDLGLATITALAFSLVFSRLRQPVVVGQLLAGILIGPFGLGLIQDLNTINLLASVGVILLLFMVGLELDAKQIRAIGIETLVLVIMELGMTFMLVFLGGLAVGLTYVESLLVALVLSPTSTAVVGKLLFETKNLMFRESHLVLTASVAEDFSIILMLLFLSGLAATNNQSAITELSTFIIKGFLLVGIIIGFGWKIAPKIIDRVDRSNKESQETAFLLAVSFGFAFALLASYLGFSPAIGAFLVGLMIRSDQARFMKEKVGPLKDLFIVLFFVSMGALINVESFFTLSLPIVVLLAVAFLAKFSGSLIGARAGSRTNDAVKVGVSMLPRGEFSFIVAREGTALGIAGQLLFPLAGLATLAGTIGASVGLRLLRPNPTIPIQIRQSTARTDSHLTGKS